MPINPDRNNRIDRYANRELHPATARALAHEALDDFDLFEEMTAIGLARAALDSPATTDRALAQAALDDQDLFETLVARGAIESTLTQAAVHAVPREGPRRKSWGIPVLGVGAAAIAAGLLTFFFLPRSPKPIEQPAIQGRRTHPVTGTVMPGIWLTRDLQPAAQGNAPIFRGAESTSRTPKPDGAIVALNDGGVSVNLGSIDGLTKGAELPVFRGAGRDKQIARIAISTVFRESARARIVDGGSVQAGDTVRVPNSAHLDAILLRVDALASNGDLKGARILAQKTISGGTPGETRRLLERLASLDYQAGAPDAAREHYEVAVTNFDQPPAAGPAERATTLASLGALSVFRDDRERTEEILQRALTHATDLGLRSEILNNLGALAELRADRVKAVDYYHQALSLKTSEVTKSQRAIVEANLSRVNNTKKP